MSINFDILSTTSIKRKKPWSKVYWLGKEREQVVLLDRRRISYLQLHNGGTKRTVGHINQYLEKVIQLFYQDENILALLSNGDILIWNKDSDVVYLVKGLPYFPSGGVSSQNKQNTSSFTVVKNQWNIVINHDLKKIIVIVDFNIIYVWHGEKSVSFTSSPSQAKKSKELIGSWFSIPVHEEIVLPNFTNTKNAILVTSFNKSHPVLSSPIQCVYSFASSDILYLSILTINPSYCNTSEELENICTWKNFNFPLKDFHPDCQTIQHSGALLASLSNDGLTLALAINQLATQAARLVFISVLNGSHKTTSLRNYALNQPITMRKKYLWLSEMTWSSDDCFVVCITKEGSVCVASRLGELLEICMNGCSLKLGPGYYLNLYPLVKPSSKGSSQSPMDDDESIVSTSSGYPNFKQRFSVTSHRKVPLLLLSDGYLVTLIRFPSTHVGTIDISSWFLQQAKVSLKPFQLERNKIGGFSSSTTKKTVLGNLTVTDMSDSWKILSTLSLSEDQTETSSREILGFSSTSSDWERRQLELGCFYMMSCWSLLSSYNRMWSKDLYSVATKTINVFNDIAEISLRNRINFACPSQEVESTPLKSVINLLKSCFKCINFDCALFNTLPSSISLLNRTVILMLSDQSCNLKVERIVTSRNLLLEMEKSLIKSYTLNLAQSVELYRHISEQYPVDDFYFYGSFNHTETSISGNIHNSTIVQRLKPAWFYLYKIILKNYQKTTDESKKDWSLLLCTIQNDLQKRDWNLHISNMKKLSRKVDLSSHLYMKGHVERATEMWLNDFLDVNKLHTTSTRKLHQILYSLLGQYKVAAAFSFICSTLKGDLLFKEKATETRNLEDLKKKILHSIIKNMDSKNINSLLQSFARFWLTYYNKKTVCIFPVHRAHSLLSDKQTYKGLRSCPLISPLITDSLTSQKIDGVLNPTMVMELLLLGGLWSESVSFILSHSNNNNFRLAFAIAASWWKTNKLIWQARSSVFPLKLEANNIILKQLTFLTSISEKNRKQTDDCSGEFVLKIRDLLLPGVLCDFDLTPIVLQNIIDRLIEIIKETNLLVPTETYLPAPPIYCPQQSIGYEEGDMPSEDTEDGFRHTVATLIERFFCIIQAAFLGFPLMAWYFSFIEKLWAAAGWNSFGEMAFSNLQFTIVTFLDMNNSSPETSAAIQWSTLEASPCGQQCLQSVRELFSLIWLLNCRDELSMACRNLSEFMLGNGIRSNKENPNYYFVILDQILFWSEKISPFRSIINTPSSLENIIFNTAKEMNFSDVLVKRIARCFPDSETLTLSGQKQLLKLKEQWNSMPISSPNYPKIGTVDIGTYQLEEMDLRRSLSKRVGKQFSQFRKTTSSLKFKKFEDCCFELEEKFLNHIEPVFQIGILKRLGQGNSEEASTPLLSTFSKQLRSHHFLTSKESIKSLVNLENRFCSRKSFLELVQQANSNASNSVLGSDTMKFLKNPGKRQSVLFRQPIRAFWSPSRRAAEKFHKLLTRVWRRRSIKIKSKKRVSNNNAVSKWRSTANLVVEEMSKQRQNLNKSVSVSNLFTQMVLGPSQAQNVKGYASKIPNLVMELQMKSNEDESLLPFLSWILTWASTGSRNSTKLPPSHLLLSLLLESRRKVPINDGRLNLVRVKIRQGSDAAKSKVSRSFSLRVPEASKVLPNLRESQTLEYFDLNENSRTCTRDLQIASSTIVPENGVNKKKDDLVKGTEKPESTLNKLVRHDNNENNNYPLPINGTLDKSKSVIQSPKKFTLPQVYQECWSNATSKITTETQDFSKKDDPNQKPFERNSPQRVSVRRKKDQKSPTTNIGTQFELINETNSEKELSNIIQQAVRSEIKKSVEDIGLGILGGAIDSMVTSMPDVDNVELPSRPVRKKELTKNIGTQASVLQKLPKLVRSQEKDKTSKRATYKNKLTRSSETSSADSDLSDSSANIRRQREPVKKSVLHKIPLLKADKETSKVSPKRYYVISDQMYQNSPKKVPLLNIEDKNDKKLNYSPNKNKINPDDVRNFIVGKSKLDTKLQSKPGKPKLLSISARKEIIPSDLDMQEHVKIKPPLRKKSSFNQNLVKSTKKNLKLSLDKIQAPALETYEESTQNDTGINICSVVSPDSCAQLQYDVYNRLRSSKENVNTNSTQTSVDLKDIGIVTEVNSDSKITYDIGLMTTPTEAELENERIKVFQRVLTSSKQTSMSDDFERNNDACNNNIKFSKTSDETSENIQKQSSENYEDDSFNSNSSKSTDSLSSQASFNTKLEGLKNQLTSIEEVSQNLEKELCTSKKVLEDAETIACGDLNLNKREKSPGITDWRKRESKMFEHRKSIILSLIDNKYKNELSMYEMGSDINDNLPETSRGRRKISFEDNYNSSRSYDDSDISIDTEWKKSFQIHSRSSEDDSFIEPRKLRELYRIYGSRRIPERVIQKIRSEYIAKQQS